MSPRTASLSATIDRLTLAEEPARWQSLGFAVSGSTVRLGSVLVELVGREAGRGILGWSLRDVASVELDGLPTTTVNASTPKVDAEANAGTRVDAEPTVSLNVTVSAKTTPDAEKHANGIVAIDHVVAMSPELDRSVHALHSAGLDLRRIREQPTPAGAPRQAFFRLGEVILELVQEPDEALTARGNDRSGPSRFWGLALLSDDLEQTVAQLGEHASEIRAAIQPGRQIATLRRSAGLAIPVALMSRAVA